MTFHHLVAECNPAGPHPALTPYHRPSPLIAGGIVVGRRGEQRAESTVLSTMPDTQNAHHAGHSINLVHDEVGPHSHQLAGARSQPWPPPVGKQSQTVTRKDESLQQVRGSVWIQRLKILDDRIPIIQRAGAPFDLHCSVLGGLEFQALDLAQHISPYLIVRYAGAAIRTCFRNGGFEQLALGLKIGIGGVDSLAHGSFIAYFGSGGEKIWRAGRRHLTSPCFQRGLLVPSG